MLQAEIDYKGMTYTARVLDVHINGNRAKALIRVEDYRPFIQAFYGAGGASTNTAWVDFNFLKFETPATPELVVHILECTDWSEQMRDEVPA